MRMLPLILTALGAAFANSFAVQTDPASGYGEPIPVVKLSQSIVFDGIPGEEAWKDVPALPMVTLMPAFGQEPTEISIVKMAYDDDHFYVSGWLNYEDIGRLRAVGKKRDYSSRSSSWFGFILDTFNDRENAVVFMTNPNGIRSDATIQNDDQDEDADFNGTWNTFWDVKTAVTEQGWSVEFRIPFSSLRYQVSRGKTRMGILIMRWSPAKPELATFPEASPKLSSAYWRPSLSRLIEFEGLRSAKPVYFTPYLIGGLSRVNALDEAGAAYRTDSDVKYDAGATLRSASRTT